MSINSKHRSIGQDNRHSFLSGKTLQGSDSTAICDKTYRAVRHNLSISNLPFSEYYCFYCRIFGFFVCITLRGPFPHKRAADRPLTPSGLNLRNLSFQEIRLAGMGAHWGTSSRCCPRHGMCPLPPERLRRQGMEPMS